MHLTYVQANRMIPGPAGVAPSSVLYEGSDALRPGHLLCANSDYGTASAVQADRWCRAEKPATGKLANFLGVVAGGRSTYPAEPGLRPINLPGSICQVWTDQNCVIDSTLLTVQPGSYIAGGVGEGLVIGRALQTVDRSSTAGLVLCKLFGVNPAHDANMILARGRTTVQMPTEAIWEKFDIPVLRANPHLGSLLDVDFTGQNDYPCNRFNDTSSIQISTTAAIGEWVMTTTDDNSACEIQWPVPILTTGGASWGFEARFKAELLTTEKASFSVGLHEYVTLVGDLQADAGALPTAANYLVFNSDAAATSALDTIYLLTGQTGNEHAAAIKTMVANTYFTVGLYYDGATIQQYVDGVAAGTSITATDIAAGDFPAAKILLPSVGLKGAHGDAFSLTLDWVRAAQYAAAAG